MRAAVWRCLRHDLASSSSQPSITLRYWSIIDEPGRFNGHLRGEVVKARYLYTVSRLTPVIRLMEAMLSPHFLNCRIVTTWDMLIIFLSGLLSRLPKQ